MDGARGQRLMPSDTAASSPWDSQASEFKCPGHPAGPVEPENKPAQHFNDSKEQIAYKATLYSKTVLYFIQSETPVCDDQLKIIFEKFC